MGRHSKFTQAVADEICQRLGDGESLVDICKSPGMPNRQTVLNWMAANEAFSALYARARDIQADYLFDEMDRVERETLAGIHHPQAVSVVLASKRWRAAMMAPKRYGDRSNVDLSVTERNPTDTEIAARVASLVALEKMKNENSGD